MMAGSEVVVSQADKKGEDVPSRFDKPVPGSTLRCLEDPIFTESIPATAAKQAVASSGSIEIEGRDRFDRFWGGGKETVATVASSGDEQKTAN